MSVIPNQMSIVLLKSNKVLLYVQTNFTNMNFYGTHQPVMDTLQWKWIALEPLNTCFSDHVIDTFSPWITVSKDSLKRNALAIFCAIINVFENTNMLKKMHFVTCRNGRWKIERTEFTIMIVWRSLFRFGQKPHACFSCNLRLLYHALDRGLFRTLFSFYHFKVIIHIVLP